MIPAKYRDNYPTRPTGRIINLTHHTCSSEQVAEGVEDPKDQQEVFRLLTFDEPPGASELRARARALAFIARKAGVEDAMIAGAPYLMGPLTEALRVSGIQPWFAFTRRDCEEDPDTGRLTYHFRHSGWVNPLPPTRVQLGVMICPACRGSGIEWTGHSDDPPCPDCNGTGDVPIR